MLSSIHVINYIFFLVRLKKLNFIKNKVKFIINHINYLFKALSISQFIIHKIIDRKTLSVLYIIDFA